MTLKAKTLILSVVLAATLTAAGSTADGSTAARWIVFSAAPKDGTEGSEIFRIRTDGSGLQQITTGRFVAVEASFAPNGKRVVFSRLSSGLFAVNLDGSGLRRLTSGHDDEYPVYSPNGKWIAFIHNRRLHVMHANGSGRRHLWRAPGPAGRPSWTPDGKSIAVPAGQNPDFDLFYTVSARNGRVERQIDLEPDLEPIYTEAALSPNGRLVAFIGRRLSPPGCQHNDCEVFALYLKSAAGGISRHLIDDGGSVGWSSDSRTIAYPYKGALRLQPLRGGAAKTIEIGTNGFGQGSPAFQPG